MNYSEIKKDLFTMDKDVTLVHCISNDHAMGAGIAKKFAELGVKASISDEIVLWNGRGYVAWGHTNMTETDPGWKVANLVTKEKYWMKPTYQTMRQALENLKRYVVEFRIRKLAMPCIGCGLDRLDWGQVSAMIKNIFRDTDVEITVCRL
jgi:O-acetyl-ADP-ribose deacetylase (regulator of RNase III)